MHQRLQSLVAAKGLAMRLLEVELQLLNWNMNNLNRYYTIRAILKKKISLNFTLGKTFMLFFFTRIKLCLMILIKSMKKCKTLLLNVLYFYFICISVKIACITLLLKSLSTIFIFYAKTCIPLL